ncbi:MAG: hypothetical protein O3A63_08090 [Proteobacteria bacterium]|nr:hypothetical protein [Pseudomonadota bacterium]
MLIGGSALLALSLLGGCVTSTVQQVREAATGIAEGESLVVLGRRSRPATGETELDFVTCIANGVSRGSGSIAVIQEEEFRDALFPWFEPRTAPLHTRELPEILAQPVLASRLEEIGLRYMVWVEGHTQRTDASGSLTCSITTAGAGCFGFLTWDNDSSYEAIVWDIKSGALAGRISSDAMGTSYMPAIVVPIPLIARVQASACSSLAKQLKQFLATDT